MGLEDYPLGARRPDLVTTPRARRLADVTLAALLDGRVTTEELRATPETLRRQADIAGAGRPAAARRQPRRAAELAAVPDETMLEVYTALRPAPLDRGGARGVGDRLERAGAPLTAAFVREALAAYAERGLLAALSEPRAERFVAREQRELRREVLIAPVAGARARRDRRPERPGAGARDRGRRGRRARRAARSGVGRASTTSSPATGIDLEAAAEAAALDDARSRAGSSTSTSRAPELVRLSRGLTPARLARVVAMLDPVELMFALKKLRARRAPANQAHVTNLKENPALLAADAAEAAARGFAEMETTVGVSRYAPLNAIAILVGSQTGRPGVLTQCAVEERRNLRLAIQGLVTYAETLSVYGTEAVFVDGDDTPWSKAFLASAYASRGVKVRFTSGGGSEALMGEREGKSMLYLEARCLALVRAAGSQGVQNGSISCVALALARAGRDAGDPRRERARRLARPRGRVRQRRDRVATRRSARRRS